MNRIEPIGPRDADIVAIPPVPRRAPDREREQASSEEQTERQHRRPEDTETQQTPPDLPNLAIPGEHVDVRA